MKKKLVAERFIAVVSSYALDVDKRRRLVVARQLCVCCHCVFIEYVLFVGGCFSVRVVCREMSTQSVQVLLLLLLMAASVALSMTMPMRTTMELACSCLRERAHTAKVILPESDKMNFGLRFCVLSCFLMQACCLTRLSEHQ